MNWNLIFQIPGYSLAAPLESIFRGYISMETSTRCWHLHQVVLAKNSVISICWHITGRLISATLSNWSQKQLTTESSISTTWRPLTPPHELSECQSSWNETPSGFTLTKSDTGFFWLNRCRILSIFLLAKFFLKSRFKKTVSVFQLKWLVERFSFQYGGKIMRRCIQL